MTKTAFIQIRAHDGTLQNSIGDVDFGDAGGAKIVDQKALRRVVYETATVRATARDDARTRATLWMGAWAWELTQLEVEAILTEQPAAAERAKARREQSLAHKQAENERRSREAANPWGACTSCGCRRLKSELDAAGHCGC